jgi:hypothetical protein
MQRQAEDDEGRLALAGDAREAGEVLGARLALERVEPDDGPGGRVVESEADALAAKVEREDPEFGAGGLHVLILAGEGRATP